MEFVRDVEPRFDDVGVCLSDVTGIKQRRATDVLLVAEHLQGTWR